MATSVSLEMTVSGSADEVRAMLADTTYLGSKGALLIKDVSDDNTRTIETSRDLTGAIPDSISRYVANPAILTEIQRWILPHDGRFHHADVSFSLAGAPARISGEANIEVTDQMCRISIELEISVAIPLFGGFAENMVADVLRKQMADEEQLAQIWLDSQ